MLHCDDIFNSFLLLTALLQTFNWTSMTARLLKKITFEKTYGMIMVKLTRRLGLWKQLTSVSRKKSIEQWQYNIHNVLSYSHIVFLNFHNN